MVALGVWVLAGLLAAIVAIIGVKWYLNTKPKPEPPVAAPLPQYPGPAPVLPDGKKPEPKPIPDAKKPPSKKAETAPPVAPPVDNSGKVALCPGISSEKVALAGDGTLLGHLPYAEANPTDLASSPTGFASGNCTQMQGEAKTALERMIEAARASDPAIGDAMVGLSCFRSITYQKQVFCRKVGDGFAARARSSAPPGYSEHATGYVMDIGDRNYPECNLNPCFATTPVGQWLATNAGQYGFVLSFPKGNVQGVMYEPWHWRYEGSGGAKAVFANAK